MSTPLHSGFPGQRSKIELDLDQSPLDTRGRRLSRRTIEADLNAPEPGTHGLVEGTLLIIGQQNVSVGPGTRLRTSELGDVMYRGEAEILIINVAISSLSLSSSSTWYRRACHQHCHILDIAIDNRRRQSVESHKLLDETGQ